MAAWNHRKFGMFVTRLIDKLTNGVKSTLNRKSANHQIMAKKRNAAFLLCKCKCIATINLPCQ